MTSGAISGGAGGATAPLTNLLAPHWPPHRESHIVRHQDFLNFFNGKWDFNFTVGQINVTHFKHILTTIYD